MSMIFFTFRSQTQARRGAMVLRNRGLRARPGRTPAWAFQNGCGYGVWVSAAEGHRAAGLLRAEGAAFSRSYLVEDEQRREVFL